jgi:hypothetical protein
LVLTHLLGLFSSLAVFIFALFGAVAFHAGKALGQVLEELLDIDACLCTCLNEHHIEFLSKGLAFLSADLSLLGNVDFVADEHDEEVVAADGLGVVDPLSHVRETCLA